MSAGTELDCARDAMNKAEAIKNRWIPFSGKSKYREAAQHYENASNLFRIGKDYTSAGKALLLSAEMYNKCNAQRQTMEAYIKAANIFRKENPDDAIMCLQTVINFYTETGKFSMAARHQLEIAKILENSSELQKAIDAYETAAEYYEGDNNSRDAAQCLLKVAYFSAELEKYDRATEIFEQIGKIYVNNSLMKFSTRYLFLKGCLCYLANNDLIGAQRALDRYIEIDPTFLTQRECKFLRSLINSIEELNMDNFSVLCADHDSVTPFDSWTTTILLRVKNGFFNSASNDLPEDLS
jgi:alpha-soluble NSF attachment protein